MSDTQVVKSRWQLAGHSWPLLVAACLGLAVALSAWFVVSAWEERLAKAKFLDVAGDYATVLQNGLDEHLAKLLAVRAFFDSSVEVDAAEFELFTSQILTDYARTMRVAWCPRVVRDERVAFEAKESEFRGRPFSIMTWAPHNPLSASPDRDEYFPIIFSTVLSARRATFGVDLNSETSRSQAIARARDGNVMATAQNVTMRDAIAGKRPAFFVALPVYRQGIPSRVSPTVAAIHVASSRPCSRPKR
jgi:CHASE1-domain containing sensor protein